MKQIWSCFQANTIISPAIFPSIIGLRIRNMVKYPKYDNGQLPGYILPKTRRKSPWHEDQLKIKSYPLRFTKTGKSRSFSTSNTHCNIDIGFIGLGRMGYNMASNLITKIKSSKFVIHDTESSVLSKFKTQHSSQHADRIIIADSAKAVAQQADVIITMLPKPQHVKSVYLGDHGLLEGLKENSICIDSSTIDPMTCKLISSSLTKFNDSNKKGCFMIDAPVSGGIMGAFNGTLTFMVGANSQNEFNKVRPYLELMGKNIVYCGNVGNGQIAKICNNMLLGITMIGASEAMNLGVKLGMDSNLLAGVLNTSSGRCWVTDTYNPCPGVMENVPASRDYEGGFENSLMVKDLGLAVQSALEVKSTVILGSTALQIYNQLAATPEFARKDFSSVFKWLMSASTM